MFTFPLLPLMPFLTLRFHSHLVTYFFIAPLFFFFPVTSLKLSYRVFDRHGIFWSVEDILV